jgi:hypothetical protein
MLIAWLGTRHNRSSTQGRRFPNSASARKLFDQGFTEVGVAFVGLPKAMQIAGTNATTEWRAPMQRWKLSGEN